MKRHLFSLFFATLSLCAFAGPKSYSLASPDGKLKVNVTEGKEICYSVSFNGTRLLISSPISMSMADGSVYGGAVKANNASVKAVKNAIKAVAYKKAEVKDNYNELSLQYTSFELKFRAYDEGIAYRFVSKANKPFIIRSEQATFSFPEDWMAYIPYSNGDTTSIAKQYLNSFENYYKHIALSEINPNRLVFLPIVVEAPEGVKICITESDLLNYPGMFLRSNGTNTLKGVMAEYPKTTKQSTNLMQSPVFTREDYIAKAEAEEAFPWRIIMVAAKDRDLTNNDMAYRLGTAPKGDWSWLKPGKVSWDWWNNWNIYGVDSKAGINTQTYKYYIDFAAAHNIEYIVMDEGWRVKNKANLFYVVPEIDMEELCRYGKEKNVGIFLWSGYYPFYDKMEEVCKHYSQMGIKGFKLDFIGRDDQVMVDFLTNAAQTTAKYHLMLDLHGMYKPAGLNRTYPNVVNLEGVAGLEQMKWQSPSVDQVTYDVTIPYIRMTAGPMDYTQGAMRNAIKGNYVPINTEPMSQGTRCHQLAEYIVFDSPLAMLCDSPSNYMKEPECTGFIASVPTTWQQTIALDGAIGEFVVTARQAADGSWFVGALNNWKERDITVDLHFLDNAPYDMTIFQDGVNADRNACDFKQVSAKAPANRLFQIHLAPGGGWAARLVRH